MEKFKPAIYLTMYKTIQEIAIDNGYSCAFHGSMTRDFDLVLIPWGEKPTPHEDVVKEIARELGTHYLRCTEPKFKRLWNRCVYILNLRGDTAGSKGYLDLSVLTHHEK